MKVPSYYKNYNLLVFIDRVISFFLVGIALLTMGCANSTFTYMGGPSSFDSYYKACSFEVPEIAKIKKIGKVREYYKPFNEVHKASLDILSQYQGILATNSSGSHHSMLVLKAREYKCAPEDKRRIATYGSFFEQWLAVAIVKTPDEDVTEVAVAAINPMGNVVNNEAAAQLLFSQIQIQLYSRMQWREKFIFETRRTLPWQSETESLSPTDIGNEPFQYHELEQVLGGWISRSMKEELFTIHCPEVSSWLEGIVDRLKQAAGVPHLKTKVVVIPANGLNAFSLPSGEILVSSGLLDGLDTPGQIASVLAHELDHLIHHDTVERLKTKRVGLGAAAGLRTTIGLADVVVGAINSVNPTGPVVGALWDMGRAGGRHLAEQGAQHLETALVTNFTADIELRADSNGIRMLLAAGYDPSENISMLGVLKKYQNKELVKNETVMFNLVNLKPGIDERIKNLKKVMAELQK